MKMTSSHSNQGFSLVEMLTVIAVIGIVSSIAIPGIGRINEVSKESTNRRNAQNIASVATSAEAAGLDFIVKDDIDQTLTNVKNGGQVNGGTFDGAYFGVPSISQKELDEAKRYLKLDGNHLSYSAVAQSGATATASGLPIQISQNVGFSRID